MPPSKNRRHKATHAHSNNNKPFERNDASSKSSSQDTAEQGYGHTQQTEQEAADAGPSSAGQFSVCANDDECISVWMWDLLPVEKMDVLSLSLEELVTYLQSCGNPLDPSLLNTATTLLSHQTYVTQVRNTFVDAMHNEGQIDITVLRSTIPSSLLLSIPSPSLLDAYTTAILKVMELHLVLAQTHKAMVSKLLCCFAFYCLHTCELTALLRYPVFCTLVVSLFICTAHSAGPVHSAHDHPTIRLYQSVLHSVLELFESTDVPVTTCSEILRARVNGCCCWFWVCVWCTWFGRGQYWLMVVLCLLPLLFTEVEPRLRITAVTAADHRTFKYIRMTLSTVAQLICVYLAYHSYITLFFTILFFFPSITSVCISSLCVVIAAVFPLSMIVQSRLFTFNEHPIAFSLLYIITLVGLYFTVSISYLLSALHVIAVCVVTPPVISTVISMVAATIAQLVLSMGLTKLLFLICELVLLVVLAVIVWCVQYGYPWSVRLAEKMGLSWARVQALPRHGWIGRIVSVLAATASWCITVQQAGMASLISIVERHAKMGNKEKTNTNTNTNTNNANSESNTATAGNTSTHAEQSAESQTKRDRQPNKG